MKHHFDPSLTRNNVRKDANIFSGPVYVETERVLTLVRSWIEIARLHDTREVDAPFLKGTFGELRRVYISKQTIQAYTAVLWKLLKEGVGVMPRPNLPDAESGTKAYVKLSLPTPEWFVGELLDLGEKTEQPFLRQLLQLESHAVEVGVAEIERDRVADASKFPHSIGDYGTDLLGGLPNSSS